MTLVVIGFYFRMLYKFEKLHWVSEPSLIWDLLILLILLAFVPQRRQACQWNLPYGLDLITGYYDLIKYRCPFTEKKVYCIWVGGCLCMCMYVGVCFPVYVYELGGQRSIMHVFLYCSPLYCLRQSLLGIWSSSFCLAGHWTPGCCSLHPPWAGGTRHPWPSPLCVWVREEFWASCLQNNISYWAITLDSLKGGSQEEKAYLLTDFVYKSLSVVCMCQARGGKNVLV